jgi:hypothetical protein
VLAVASVLYVPGTTELTEQLLQCAGTGGLRGQYDDALHRPRANPGKQPAFLMEGADISISGKLSIPTTGASRESYGLPSSVQVPVGQPSVPTEGHRLAGGRYQGKVSCLPYGTP